MLRRLLTASSYSTATSTLIESQQQQQQQLVRNVGIIAHIDAGKTTTTERMLYLAGVVRRFGSVDQGTTVTDFLPQERERGITIASACITFPWRHHPINLIDTPGHVDFLIEVQRSLSVLDGAIAVFDGVAGVEAQTETVWREAENRSIPKIAFINKLDRMGANMLRVSRDLEQKFKVKALPLHLSLNSNDEFKGIFDLVSKKLITDETTTEITTATGSLEDQVKTAREELIETLCELDDVILEEFLTIGDPMLLGSASINAAIRRATLDKQIVPVLGGSAVRNIGVTQVLDALVDFLPSPLERTVLTQEGIPLSKALKNDALCAFAFKVVWDPQRGPVVFIRVYSGVLKVKDQLLNAQTGRVERAHRLLQVFADHQSEVSSITAGNIGVIIGLKHVKTGDTLLRQHGQNNPIMLESVIATPPVFFRTVEPYSLVDEEKVQQMLQNLLLEDPSLFLSVDEASGQWLLSGQGELHLEIAQHRLLNDWNVKAEFGQLRISYAETLKMDVNTDKAVNYDKIINGKRTRVNLTVSISLLDPTTNNGLNQQGNLIILPDLSGVAGSEELRIWLREGAEAGCTRGPLAGFNLRGIKVTIKDVETFKAETTPSAIRAACNEAIFQALQEAGTVLLEPMMLMSLSLPENRTGPILNDLTGRRDAQIISVNNDESLAKTLISARVPLERIMGYASELRSMTEGKGAMTMKVDGWERMAGPREKDVLRKYVF